MLEKKIENYVYYREADHNNFKVSYSIQFL